MQILFTRSKISSRRLYESFTFNRRCKSYVCDSLKEGMDESICVVCNNLVLTSTLQQYYLYDLPLELMRKKLQPPPDLFIIESVFPTKA
jgi:hypothetical protein